MIVPNPPFTVEELARLEQEAAHLGQRTSQISLPIVQVCRLVAAARMTTGPDKTGYDVLIESMEKAPCTWRGGLLACIVKLCIDEKFFKDREALMGFVGRAAGNLQQGTEKTEP